MRSRHLGAVLIPAFISLPVALLPADQVTLSNGRVIQGKVLSEGDSESNTVTIETASGGKVSVPRSEVRSIERGPTAKDALAAKEKELAAGDAGALVRLASWCEAEGLKKDRDRLLWRALEIDPNQADARETLGFRRLGALWLTEAEYQHHQGNVEVGGKWIPRAEWKRRQEESADRAVLDAATGAIHDAARAEGKPEEATAALAAFRDAPEGVQRYALAQSLDSRDHRTRQLAVRLTGNLSGKRPAKSLTHVAVSDPRRSVRDEALRVLKTWGDPDTALAFIPYLESQDDRERVNASRALNVFPDRRAVPALVTSAHMIWAGFGRSFFAQLVERSYVQDYELVSGGTGLVVSEVADPVIDTFIDGIVLDIDVRRAEAFSRIATLEKITGQNFGTDFEAWAKWWKDEQGKERAG